MHPQVVWLFKKLRKMRDIYVKKGLTVDEVDRFCKQLNPKKHAICMMGALFDISHSDTPLGDIVRDIDRVAISYQTKREALKKYDNLLVEALDSGVNSSLYNICENYKNQYNQRLPDLYTTDFDKISKNVTDFKKPKIFDPANLFQGA